MSDADGVDLLRETGRLISRSFNRVFMIQEGREKEGIFINAFSKPGLKCL